MSTNDSKIENFNVDFELDSIKNVDDINRQITNTKNKKNVRTPISDTFKGSAIGFTDQLSESSFLTKLLKRSLPEQWGEVFDEQEKASVIFSDIYDNTIKKLKSPINELSTLLKNKTKKGTFLNKVAGSVSDSTKSYESIVNKSIGDDETHLANQVVDGVFKKDQEEEEVTKEKVKAKIEDKKIETEHFKFNMNALNSMNESLLSLSDYNTSVTKSFQKKSLELQYRSYFKQSELLKKSIDFFTVTKNQNDAITLNTSLPEYDKLLASERFKETIKHRTIDSVNTALFGKETAFDRISSNFKTKINDFISDIKEGMEESLSAIGGLEDLVDMEKEAEDLNKTEDMDEDIDDEGEGDSKPEPKKETSHLHMTLGKIIGSSLAGKFNRKVSSLIRDHIKEDSDVSKVGYDIASKINDPEAIKNSFKESKFVKKEEEKEREYFEGNENFKNIFKGDKLKRAAIDSIEEILTKKKLNKRLHDEVPETDSLFNPGMFTNKTNKTIVEIIPGYLSRILKQVTIISTKNPNAENVRYDFKKKEFATDTEMSQRMGNLIKKRAKDTNHQYHVKKAVDVILGKGDYDYKVKEDVSTFIMDLAISNDSRRIKDILKSAILENNPSKTLIEEKLKEKISKGKNKEKEQYLISKSVDNVHRNLPNYKEELDSYIKDGHSDLLLKEQFISRNDTEENRQSTYSLNQPKYEELIKSDYSGRKEKRTYAKSDINVKENITTPDTESLLEIVKRIKVFDWNYKKGEGDDLPHTGPMAQDVKKEAGKEASPDGTSIDLTTMNGILMGATQELNTKFDALTKKFNSFVSGEKAGGSDNFFKEQNKTTKATNKSNTLLTSIKKILTDISKSIKSGVNVTNTSSNTNTTTNTSSDSPRRRTGKFVNDVIDITTDTVGVGLKGLGYILGKGAALGIEASKLLIKGSSKVVSSVIKNITSTENSYFYESIKGLFKGGISLAEKVLGTAKDLITNFVPKTTSAIYNFGKDTLRKGYDLIRDYEDIYIKGMAEPILRANLMKMGYYRDQATGKIIKSFSDIKGPVVDQAGKIILTFSDIAKGLVDNKGRALRGEIEKHLRKYLSLTRGARDFVVSSAKGFVEGVKDIFSGNFSLGSIVGSNKKLLEAVLDIKKILLGEYDETVVSQKDHIKTAVENKIKKKASSSFKSVKNKYSKTKENFKTKIKNKFKDPLGKEEEREKAREKEKMDELNNLKKQKEGLKPNKNILGTAGSLVLGAVGGVANKLKNKFNKVKEDIEPSKIKDKLTNYKNVVKDELKNILGKKEDLTGTEYRFKKEDEREKAREKEKMDELNNLKKQKEGLKTNKPSTTILGMIASGVASISTYIALIAGSVYALKKVFFPKSKAPTTESPEKKTKAQKKTKINSVKDSIKKGSTKAGNFTRPIGKKVATEAGKYVTKKVFIKAGTALLAGAGLALGLFSAPAVAFAVTAATVADIGLDVYRHYADKKKYIINKYNAHRFTQYGFYKRNENIYNSLTELELYLQDGKIIFGENPFIDISKVDFDHIYTLFNIETPTQKENFGHWFTNRFKPIFLNSLKVLKKLDPSLELYEVNKLNKEDLSTFIRDTLLNKISNKVDPYAVKNNPFGTKEQLINTKSLCLDFARKNTIKKVNSKKKFVSKKKSKDTVFKDLKKEERVNHLKGSDYKLDSVMKLNPADRLIKGKVKNNNKVMFNGEEGKEPTSSNIPKNKSTKKGGKLNTATGKRYPASLEEGLNSGAILAGKGVDLLGLNNVIRDNFSSMANEYYSMTNKGIHVNSGYRSLEDQKKLYARDPHKAARPGRSLHNFGLAIDCNTKDLDDLDKKGLMRKYGFTRPVGGEGWHAEPALIQGYISQVKSDPELGSSLSLESLGKGGGGLGSMSGSFKGRDTAYATSLHGKEVTNYLPKTEVGNENNKPKITTASSTAEGARSSDFSFDKPDDNSLRSFGSNNPYANIFGDNNKESFTTKENKKSIKDNAPVEIPNIEIAKKETNEGNTEDHLNLKNIDKNIGSVDEVAKLTLEVQKEILKKLTILVDKSTPASAEEINEIFKNTRVTDENEGQNDFAKLDLSKFRKPTEVNPPVDLSHNVL